MIKVANIYVSEDGCGPYTLSICGGADAAYFKVIGKELYFDENRFSSTPNTTTTTQTTTVNPNSINMFFTTAPHNSYVFGTGSSCVFSFGTVQVVVAINNQVISNPQLSYQWQENINGVWTNIAGATSSSFGNYRSFNYVRLNVTYQTKTITSGQVRGYCSIV